MLSTFTFPICPSSIRIQRHRRSKVSREPFWRGTPIDTLSNVHVSERTNSIASVDPRKIQLYAAGCPGGGWEAAWYVCIQYIYTYIYIYLVDIENILRNLSCWKIYRPIKSRGFNNIGIIRWDKTRFTREIIGSRSKTNYYFFVMRSFFFLFDYWSNYVYK